MQNNSTTTLPKRSGTTEVVLYKLFHERLSQLSDCDKGRLALAIISGFLHPKPHSRGERDAGHLS